MHQVGLNNQDTDQQNREWIKKKQFATVKKEAYTPRICYPWNNDGTGAVVFPHWDMNQISTHRSLEVRAGISLTGHLFPEHGHQGVHVATLIVMSPSSPL